jgi:hypothetical protein
MLAGIAPTTPQADGVALIIDPTRRYLSCAASITIDRPRSRMDRLSLIAIAE